MTACARVHLYGEATRRATGELAGAPIMVKPPGIFFPPS